MRSLISWPVAQSVPSTEAGDERDRDRPQPPGTTVDPAGVADDDGNEQDPFDEREQPGRDPAATESGRRTVNAIAATMAPAIGQRGSPTTTPSGVGSLPTASSGGSGSGAMRKHLKKPSELDRGRERARKRGSGRRQRQPCQLDERQHEQGDPHSDQAVADAPVGEVCRDADQEENAGKDDREPYVLVGC